MRSHRYSRWWRDAKGKTVFQVIPNWPSIQTGMNLKTSVALDQNAAAFSRARSSIAAAVAASSAVASPGP